MQTADNTGHKEMFEHLVRLGRLFHTGKPFPVLFKEIMEEIRHITGAEGGSLYIYDWVSQTLKIVVLTNDVLKFEKVVSAFDPLRIDGFIEVPMRGDDGALDLKNLSVRCFHGKNKILVPDLAAAEGDFDFTKTRAFDRENKYKTRNLAAFPLTGHGEEVIGVLQIVNAGDGLFSERMQEFIDTLAGQISIALNNALLVSEAQNLLAAIAHMVGVAIDEKSPHTAGHCERVTELTMMIVGAMEKEKSGEYAGFSMSSEQRRELRMAAMLHDVGKIITPIHIMEKPTKLYTLYDRINVLQERLQAWEKLEKAPPPPEPEPQPEAAAADNGNAGINSDSIADDINFLNAVNRGEIFVDDETKARLNVISQRFMKIGGNAQVKSLISEEELRNLQVQRGTLNPEERKIMEEHVSASIRLLSSIPWPRNYNRVVEYAGNHHESMNGKGYPNGLTGDQMSLESRVLGLADRFEAISASDRPYRKVKMPLSRVMKIMQEMADSNEIDPALFDLFKQRKVYLAYARRFMPGDLIDCD